jgi:hypothetical protein
MQINVTFDQSISSLPAGFVSAVNYVVNYFDSLFTNPVTVNIDVGYGEVMGQTLGSGALGESITFLNSYTYSSVTAALTADATSPAQKAAYATLPASTPLTGGTLWLSTAQAKALGASPNVTFDGYVGFSSTLPFSYSPTATPPTGQYYFVGTVEHEFSEVLGRSSFLGSGIDGTTSYSLMDLFRYSAPGVRDLTATPPTPYTSAYFSTNGGTTNLDNFNTTAGGDLGDWANSVGNDSFHAFSKSGVINPVTPADLTLMNVLGWDLAPTTVQSITASPTSGVEGPGQTIAITVAFSGPVAVSNGLPTLALNDNAVATYSATATAALNDPTKLVFDYTVATSDSSVSTLAVVGSSLNGASINDPSGSAAGFANLSASFANLSVAIPPATVTSVTTSPASGVEGIGQLIKFTVTMNKGVTISGGLPSLQLNDGGIATYDPIATAALNDPTKFVLDYTVAATDHDESALAIVGGTLNGASINDMSGNFPNFSGLLTSFPALSVAIPPATVTSVTASPASGVEGVGQLIKFTVTMSKGVTISGGLPSLQLNDGGTATYDPTATAALNDPTKFVLDYTVAASDHDESALAIVGGSLNGANINDTSGNFPNFSGLLTSFPALGVAVPPATVVSVITSPASGVEGVGAAIKFTMTMSKGLTISGGLPTLQLNDGGTATYDPTATAALNDPTRLVFDYTVAASDHNVNALAIVGGNLNGAAISDTSGNYPDFSGMLTSFPSVSVLVSSTSSVASFLAPPTSAVEGGGQSTTLAAANASGVDGTTSRGDERHMRSIALLGQYAAADFHTVSDFHGGTSERDHSLSGAALSAFLGSPHT